MIRTILICKLIELCMSRVFAHIEHVTKPRKYVYNVGDQFTKLTHTTVNSKGSDIQYICVTMYDARITGIGDGGVSLLVVRRINDVCCSVNNMNTQLHSLLSRYGYADCVDNVRTLVCEHGDVTFDTEKFEKILSESL